MNYTKGKTVGGWIYVLGNGNTVGLIHPNHVNKFLAVDDLYEACKEELEWYDGNKVGRGLATKCIENMRKALSKAELK